MTLEQKGEGLPYPIPNVTDQRNIENYKAYYQLRKIF